MQVGTWQINTASTSLAPGTTQAVDIFRSLDLREFALPDGSLSTEVADDKVIMGSLKKISLNLVALPNEYLHMLQAHVTKKFIAQE